MRSLPALTLLVASLLALPGLPAPAGATDALAGDDVVPDRAVVVFRGAIPADVDARLAPYGHVALRLDAVHAVSVVTEPGAVPALLAHLADDPDVALAYPSRAATVQFVPNDARYPDMWGPPTIQMPAAWDHGLGSHAVKVAVLDTGLDYFHEDHQANTFLADPLACGPDLALLGVAGPLAIDDHGHGTHVAGTVAATTDNGVGVAGMAQACLMNVKVCTFFGSCPFEVVASGILHATAHGAHVVSMSIGGGFNDPILHQVVQLADSEGVLLVAAAGNTGCGNVLYPAKFPEVVAVGGTARPGDARYTGSACGPEVEVSAPGASVLSTCRGGGYCSYSGTSMSTPHVSGVAALVWDANLALTNTQVRCILGATADDIGAPGRDNAFGLGRIDAAEAVAAATNPAGVGC